MRIVRPLLEYLTQTRAIAVLEGTLGTGGIVAYHAVTPAPLFPSIHISTEAFRKQLEFLAGSYSVVPLAEFVRRRTEGRSVRRCVAITFDDAYTGVLDLALPVLERLALPATVFVVSGHSATGARYWWDRLEWVMRGAPPNIRDQALRAATGAASTPDDLVLASVLKNAAGRVRPAMDAALAEAEKGLDEVPLHPLREAGLARLGESLLIDFGCHTVSHPAMPLLTVGEQEWEISECARWLRERLPRVLPYLAYPYGLYSRTTLIALHNAGMTAGFSLTGRAATSRCNLAACPRIGLAEGNSVTSLRARLNWAAIPLVALRNREWHPRVPSPNAGVEPPSPGPARA